MIISHRAAQLQFSAPPGAQTLAGFRQWVRSGEFPESGRISLVAGHLLVDMNPERFQSHNKVKVIFTRVISALVDDEDLGEFFGDGMWLTNDDALLSTEPDAAFASWESLDSGRLTAAPSTAFSKDDNAADDVDEMIELRGAFDWVLEVISPGSVGKDKRLLPPAYHRAGIKELWLVDARRRDLECEVFVWAEDGYVAVEPTSDGWLTSTVFQRQFRLTRERKRTRTWRYQLQWRRMS